LFLAVSTKLFPEFSVIFVLRETLTNYEACILIQPLGQIRVIGVRLNYSGYVPDCPRPMGKLQDQLF